MASLAVLEFQATLTDLANRSIAALDRILAHLDRLSTSESMSYLTEAYPTLLDPFLSASGELTTQWYSEQPTAPRRRGSRVFIPEVIPLPPPEQLAASARWAATQSDPVTALKGNATRNMFTQSRKTVLDNVEREGVRYARHARESACGFCRMLATRSLTSTEEYGATGSLYRTGVNADRSPHRDGIKLQAKGHDHCHCVVVPVRDGEAYSPEPYFEQWTADYYKARKELEKTDGYNNPIEIAKLMERADAKRAYVAEVQEVDDIVAAAISNLDAELKNQTSPETEKLSRLDRVLAQATQALEAGDSDKADKLFAKAFAIEDAEKARAQRAVLRKAQTDAAKENLEREKSDRVYLLIEAGNDPAEAEAEVYGLSVEYIRRRDFIAQARRDGFVGKGFDELVGAVHADMAAAQYWRAEDDTRGVMLKRKYFGKFHPSNLWTVNDATARKVMSDEMAEWFDQNGGRITKSIMRKSILAGGTAYDMSRQTDYLQ